MLPWVIYEKCFCNIFYKIIWLVWMKEIENKIYESIENYELSLMIGQKEESVYVQKLFSFAVIQDDIEDQVKRNYQKIILKSYNHNSNPIGAMFFFNFPGLANEESNSLFSKSVHALSEGAYEMFVPIISTDTYFSDKSNSIPIVSVCTVCENVNPAPLSDETFKLFFFEPVKGFNTGNIRYKLLKEAMSELCSLDGLQYYYSDEKISDLLGHFIYDGNFSGSINIQLFSHLDSKNSFEETLNLSAENIILIKTNGSNVPALEQISSKWKLNKKYLGEIIPNEPCKITFDKYNSLIIDKAGYLDFKENKVNDKEKLRYDFSIANEFTDDVLDFSCMLKENALKLLSRENVSSKKWVKEQFEKFGMNNNLSVNLHTNSKIIKCSDENLINVALACNPSYFNFGMEKGLQRLIDDLSKAIYATGGKPVSCSISYHIPNFINEELFIREITSTCKLIQEKFDFPINWNLSKSQSLSMDESYPLVSAMGQILSPSDIKEYSFQNKGDMIFLIGNTLESLSDEYMKMEYNKDEYFVEGKFQNNFRLNVLLNQIIVGQYVKSVQRVSALGLFVALVEACIPGRFGFDITTDSEIRKDFFLFGSMANRYIVSVSPENQNNFLDFMMEYKVPFTTLGHVTKEELRIDDISFGFIADIRKVMMRSFGERFKV